jgi:hypothetical protein
MQNTTIITKPVAVVYAIIILMFSIFKYAETYDNSGDTTIARTSLFLGAYVKMRVGEELKIRRIA